MVAIECARCQTLEHRLANLQAEIESLRQQLDEARRASKRQAGPLAKGPPKPNPKRPGRKLGKDYGTKSHRQTTFARTDR
jgi:transposase